MYSKWALRVKNEIQMLRTTYTFLGEPTIEGEKHTIDLQVKGPVDSPFEGGHYHVQIVIDTATYPFKAPVLLFKSKIYHPNILGERICVDILDNNWSPAMSLISVLKSLELLMVEPNVESVLDVNASNDFQKEYDTYKAINMSLIK